MSCLSNDDGCAKGTMNRGGRPPLIDCQPCTEAEMKAAQETKGGGFKDWWTKNGTTVLNTGTAILSSIQNSKNNNTPPVSYNNDDSEGGDNDGSQLWLVLGGVVVVSLIIGIGYYIFKPKS